MQVAMSKMLRDVTSTGNMHESVLTINCSSSFNLRSIVVTRKSIWRLCGHGATAADRYLDDQVLKIKIIFHQMCLTLYVHALKSLTSFGIYRL